MYSVSSTSDSGVFCAETAYAWAEGGCVSRLRTREITERAYDSFHSVCSANEGVPQGNSVCMPDLSRLKRAGAERTRRVYCGVCGDV